MNEELKKIIMIFMVTIIMLPFSLLNVFADDDHPIVGVTTGSIFDEVVKNDNPNAQIEYFNYVSDLPIALDAGKIDSYAIDEPVAKKLCSVYEDHMISKKLTFEEYAVIVNINRTDLLKELNDYITSLQDSGELNKMQDKWLGSDEDAKKVDYKSIENNYPIINLAVNSIIEPFDYVKDGEYAGYEIDLVASFCKEYGYGLHIDDTNLSGVLAGISTGKDDFGVCVATITEERKKTMNFSIPIYEGGTVIVKKKRKQGENIDSFSDLEEKNIGVQSGATYDTFVENNIENPNIQYYNLISDMCAALDSNRIDGFAVDKPVADAFINENPSKYRILGSVYEVPYGVGFPKTNPNSEKLCKEFDDFLTKIKNDGTLDELYEIWVSTDDTKKVIDKKGLTGENGLLVYATSSSTGIPFSYIKDDEIVGFELDLAYRFCREYGYDIKVDDYSLNGFYTALPAGKCDFGGAGTCITEERMETILFPQPYYESDCVIVVRNYNNDISNVDNSNLNFFERIIDSFYKTFIRESRYKLFLSGIFTTMFVTILAIIFGTICGFILYMIYRELGAFGQSLIDRVSNFILKTPVVVILMILYYIVFSKIQANGIVVSIIGLTILFANSVEGLLQMGVDSVDKGQMESALALGYTPRKAFIRMVLPQAISNVISGYKSSIVSIIKDSSIIGYIAVQDLTKVSDIVRSRTYEAFFPLIATAIIYYLIATALIAIVNKIEIKVDYKNKI